MTEVEWLKSTDVEKMRRRDRPKVRPSADGPDGRMHDIFLQLAVCLIGLGIIWPYSATVS